ncbi:MAG: hypothetical protein V4501_01500 [Pseudomonadota bacterium]
MPNKSARNSYFSVVYQTYRTIINHPVQAVTSLIVMLQPISLAMAATPPMARLDQCPLKATNPDALFIQPTCSTVAEIIKNYDIITNIPNWLDAKYFLIGDLHNVMAHQKLKTQFVNALAEPGDYIRFEMLDSALTVDCADTCISLNTEPLTGHETYRVRTGADVQTECDKPEAIPTHFSSSLICRGWDNEDILKPFMEKDGKYLKNQKKIYLIKTMAEATASAYSDATVELADKLAQASENNLTASAQIKLLDSIKKYHIDLCQRMHKGMDNEIYRMYFPAASIYLAQMDDLIDSNAAIVQFKQFTKKNLAVQTKKFLDLLTISSEKLADVINNFLLAAHHEMITTREQSEKLVQDVGLVNRNRHAAKVFKDHRAEPGRVFSFFGKGHMINPDRDNAKVIKKSDKQYEFRKSLEDLPHAILIPKRR